MASFFTFSALRSTPSRVLARHILGVFALLLLLGNFSPATARPAPASFVLDSVTQQTLHAHQAERYRYPASLTKVMTAYLVFQALDKGQLDLQQKLHVSPHAAQQPASKLYLQSGTTITVETALKALIIKSANDAAVTLAEAVEGEEAQFAHQMTATARAMGLRKTQFRNASGLHHPEQFTTAHNMAMLAHRLILDFPHYLYFFKDQSFEFRGQTYVTHNHLLRFMPNVAGMKTGYTKSSGYNLMSLYLSKETQLIGVVMGSNTASQRDNLMARLFAQHTAPKEQIEKQEKPAMQVTSQRKIFAARPFTQATDKDANNIFLNRQSDSTQWRLGGYLMAQARAKEAPLMQAMQKNWSVQIGAFRIKNNALAQIETAYQIAPDLLAQAEAFTMPVRKQQEVFYRARYGHFNEARAKQICAALTKHNLACQPLAPMPPQTVLAHP